MITTPSSQKFPDRRRGHSTNNAPISELSRSLSPKPAVLFDLICSPSARLTIQRSDRSKYLRAPGLFPNRFTEVAPSPPTARVSRFGPRVSRAPHEFIEFAELKSRFAVARNQRIGSFLCARRCRFISKTNTASRLLKSTATSRIHCRLLKEKRR